MSLTESFLNLSYHRQAKVDKVKGQELIDSAAYRKTDDGAYDSSEWYQVPPPHTHTPTQSHTTRSAPIIVTARWTSDSHLMPVFPSTAERSVCVSSDPQSIPRTQMVGKFAFTDVEVKAKMKAKGVLGTPSMKALVESNVVKFTAPLMAIVDVVVRCAHFPALR